MNHPALQNIDPMKLELIRTAARQTAGKSGKSMAPVMMALITSANKRGIRFTPEEISLIMDLLKEGKSAEEKRQIDQTVAFVKRFM
jgi:hypothetical protein